MKSPSYLFTSQKLKSNITVTPAFDVLFSYFKFMVPIDTHRIPILFLGSERLPINIYILYIILYILYIILYILYIILYILYIILYYTINIIVCTYVCTSHKNNCREKRSRALSYHSVRGLSFLPVAFAATIISGVARGGWGRSTPGGTFRGRQN